MKPHDDLQEVLKLAETLRNVKTHELKAKIVELQSILNSMRMHNGIISLPEYSKLQNAYRVLKKVLRYRNGHFPLSPKIDEDARDAMRARSRSRQCSKRQQARRV